jgi:hypothetical protein
MIAVPDHFREHAQLHRRAADRENPNVNDLRAESLVL